MTGSDLMAKAIWECGIPHVAEDFSTDSSATEFIGMTADYMCEVSDGLLDIAAAMQRHKNYSMHVQCRRRCGYKKDETGLTSEEQDAQLIRKECHNQ